MAKITPSKDKCLDIKLGTNYAPIFFSGRKDPNATLIPPRIRGGIMLSAINDLQVVDTTLGVTLVLESGDTVFTLIPRRCAIEKLTYVDKTLHALHALEEAKKMGEMRGKTRIPVAENDAKYITVGLKPSRGTTGIIEYWPEKCVHKDRKAILN